MNHKLLSRLTISSMKNSKRTRIPYLIAGTTILMFFYILLSLAFCPYIQPGNPAYFYGADYIAIFLKIGSVVVGFFAVIFMLYANQFLMKDRRREFGLYGILGLTKKNITVMLALETLINAGICLGACLVIGTFLNKIMLLILFKIIGQAPVSGLFIFGDGVKATVELAAAIFVATFIWNVLSVRVGNPIELLASNRTGEKEPKTKWFMLIMGIGFLAGGYYGAISCKSPLEVVNTLLICILLVIAGTYCLFISGSIFILKTLKRSKKFYYKTNNFVSVSNLIYRMKHNAAGLASICILATAVILLMTCTTSLVILGNDNINMTCPKDIMITTSGMEENAPEVIESKIKDIANEAGIEASDIAAYSQLLSVMNITEDGIATMDAAHFDGYNLNTMQAVYFMKAAQYNSLTSEDVQLKENEILYLDHTGTIPANFAINGTVFTPVGPYDEDLATAVTDFTYGLFNSTFIVLSDSISYNTLLAGDVMSDASNAVGANVEAGFNFPRDTSDQQINAFTAAFKEMCQAEDRQVEIEIKRETTQMFKSIYGGVFFVGIFLAILFLMATVMIIYYKQMSEGYEDQKRYEILKKVGLTETEVKKTINRQVMILFFLPVLTAIIHMIVASKMVRLFFKMILIVDPVVFGLTLAGVSIVFLLVYIIVYKITSASYYSIVNARG